MNLRKSLDRIFGRGTKKHVLGSIIPAVQSKKNLLSKNQGSSVKQQNVFNLK